MKKISTRRWLLPICVIAIIGYAIADIYIQLNTSAEISPTLTTCWFAFWTVELWNLAGITKKKMAIKEDYNELEPND